MKATSAQKIKIGIFTIAGIAVLVGGIFVIGSKKNMFGNTFPIYGTFKNVGGLQPGNNVRFAGINVGTVVDIIIVNDTTVRVDMKLEAKVKPFLKSDAMASIGSDGLMGDKLIIISPGGTEAPLMASGGQVNTVNPVDFEKVINKITRVADNAEVITASLASISNQISSGKGSIGKLIYTDDLQKGLVGTVNAAQSTMESAHEAIKSVKKGTEGFSENMEAAKHSFLLKGYFKKQAKEKARKAADSAAKATGAPLVAPDKKQLRQEKRAEKKEAKEEKKTEPIVVPEDKK